MFMVVRRNRILSEVKFLSFLINYSANKIKQIMKYIKGLRCKTLIHLEKKWRNGFNP